MKKWKWILPLLLLMLALTACSSEQKELYDQALQNLEWGNYQEAYEQFQTVAADDWKLMEAWRGSGIALLRLGQYEEAIEAFEIALEQKGADSVKADICLYKATAEYENKDTEQALNSCQESIDLTATAQGYLLLGKIQLDQLQYEEAEQAFVRSVRKEASYENYLGIYQIYAEKDMNADGESWLEEALELEDETTEDHYQRGRIYYYIGDTDNACAELIDAANEGYGEALLFLGHIYLETGDIDSARAIYQEYIDTEDSVAAGYNGLALCDMAEENYDAALGHIQSGLDAADSAADEEDLLFNEIVAYEKKLDFATALTKAEEFLETYPDHEEAQKEYEFLLYR